MKNRLSEMSLFLNSKKSPPRDARIDGLAIIKSGTVFCLQGKFMSMEYPAELCEVRTNSLGQTFTALKHYETREQAEQALISSGIPEIK